jgi:hypothetical protein
VILRAKNNDFTKNKAFQNFLESHPVIAAAWETLIRSRLSLLRNRINVVLLLLLVVVLLLLKSWSSCWYCLRIKRQTLKRLKDYKTKLSAI